MNILNAIFGKKSNISREIFKDESEAFVGAKDFKIIEGDKNSSLGWGVAYKSKNFITHSKLPLSKSSLVTFSSWQRNLLLGLIFIFVFGLFFDIKMTLIIIIALLSSVYFVDFIFSSFVLLKSLNSPPEIKVGETEIKYIPDEKLPVYSLLCPLYKEEKVLPQFIKAIDSLDWPKDKLDVILLLEEDDKATITAAKNMNLPDFIRVLIVPHGLPKTKPKACNYGLNHAKGEYVVIYDAEDRPDPLQLKKAYLSFKKLPDKVICLQSKLNYYNSEQNLLTHLFTAEYSLWFDLILPGLQSVESMIPLGGTSNHFKTDILRSLHGWDAFNVTEDCDLGARIFKMGYKTEIIDSTTFEEANSKLKSWIRQRSRWIKGYLQTYLVHMRDPLTFFKNHGIQSLVFQLTIGMRMVFILINPILWMITIAYFIFNPLVGAFIESLYPAPVFYLAVFTLVLGNFMHFYNYMIGCAKRGYWEIIQYVFLIPFYWLFASISSLIAFYQLIVKPYFWEKTEHGLHLTNAFAEIKISLEFDTGFPRLGGDLIRKLFSPFVMFAKNLTDLIDVFGPLPESANGQGLKILVLNWRDTKHIWAGGAEIYVHEIAKRWVAQDNNVTLFCGWDGKSMRNENVEGVNVIRRGGFYTVYFLAALYYFLRFRGKYDLIVDCENGIPFFTPLYAGIPKILLIHHVHQEVFRKHLPVLLSNLALFLESTLMPYLYRGSRIITISQSSKEDILKRGWSYGREIEIVNPGISITQNGFYQKTEYPSFLYLGRLRAYKNIDVAIRAFAKIVAKYPQARLTIAGFGETFSGLVRLAKNLGLKNSVVFSGRVSDEEKTKLFGESWVSLQPSSIEGWGITVIEANACGTPVIASDVKGLKDSVKDDLTGYLIEEGNIGIFAEAMDYLIANPSERVRLGNNCLEWSKYFSWDKSAGEFLELINLEVQKAQRFMPSLELINE